MKKKDKLYVDKDYNMNIKLTNTCQHLFKALYKLIEFQSFESLTVRKICEEACISRSNFYNHFEDKYHLLFFYLKIDSNKLHEDKCSNLSYEYIFKNVFDNKIFFKSLLKHELDSEIRLLQVKIREDIIL